jgi:hypothetical protein
MVNMRPLRLHSRSRARNHAGLAWKTPFIAGSPDARHGALAEARYLIAPVAPRDPAGVLTSPQGHAS